MTHISDLWNLDIVGHQDIDFIDINVDGDIKLFIDPCRIEISRHPVAEKCRTTLASYFDLFFQAYSKNDIFLQQRVLSHAREQNCTHLGYGYPGKGNTQSGLRKKLAALPILIQRVRTMSKPEDLPVFLTDFAEDGLSDLLTNILHDDLNEYTFQQMEQHGISPNGRTQFYTWDIASQNWILVTRPCYMVDGYPIMLVPKEFVRPQYLFSTDQYFKRIILEYIRSEGGGIGADGKLIPKSQFYKHIPHDTPDWLYQHALQYTEDHPELLLAYHQKLPGFYLDNDWLSDDCLDQIVYGDDTSIFIS